MRKPVRGQLSHPHETPARPVSKRVQLVYDMDSPAAPKDDALTALDYELHKCLTDFSNVLTTPSIALPLLTSL